MLAKTEFFPILFPGKKSRVVPDLLFRVSRVSDANRKLGQGRLLLLRTLTIHKMARISGRAA